MRLLVQRAELHGGKFIFRPFFFEREQRRAHVRAAGNAVNDHA